MLWGRRRVGKTRLLVEWVARRKGVYFVADESTPGLQRQRFAEAVSTVLPGFGEVEPGTTCEGTAAAWRTVASAASSAWAGSW